MKAFMFFLSAAAALAQPLPQQQRDLIDRQQKFMLLDQGDFLRAFAFKGAPYGRWLDNPDTAQRLNLTTAQIKKMDDIFQQNRLQLIDLNANLQKAEAILEPLVDADQPDDNKVVAQIDRVAQARADLEKANARMLWAIRRVLTPDQWKNLQGGSPKPKPLK